MDGQFPVGDQSYRAFTPDWTGHPADRPAAAVDASGHVLAQSAAVRLEK
jgi:hypothetical protein